MPRLAPLIAVVGPTGSGKSELSLRIAEELGGEILNCDSLQVFRYFDIGTAKLSLEQRRGVPHHLLDVADPDETFTAGDYAARARLLLGEIAARGRLPVLAGGTGFYLRALLEGLFAGPRRDEALRARLAERRRRRPGSLHRLLGRMDPAGAARIHPNDVQKTIRALEVSLLARRPLSDLHALGREALQGFRTLKIGIDPPRAALYQHLDARCRRMFESGLIEEVEAILARGYPPTLKPFESHGYRQAIQFLAGRLTLEAAIEEARQNTRRYAKRQWTWFHHEKEVLWYTGFGTDPELGVSVLQKVRDFVTQS